MRNARSHTRFDNSLCNQLQTIPVGLIVAFVNREVEPKASIDLHVNEARTIPTICLSA